MARSYDLFVPGRVCLFGEHSDWAGGHRRVNSAILPGQVIIAGTNQGAYARVKAVPGRRRLMNRLLAGQCIAGAALVAWWAYRRFA